MEAGRPVLGGTPGARSLTASRFSVDPGRVEAGGGAARFSYRIDGRSRRVRVRIDLVRAGRVSRVIRLGYKRTGRDYTRTWKAPAALAAGTYEAQLQARDARGRELVRTSAATGRTRIEVVARPAPAPPPVAPLNPSSGTFPVQGAFSLGGDDARFGAPRRGHTHQGHDVTAAAGTPVVSPRAGVVYWRAYQASGAGHYLVVRGDDNRDYVFMHLLGGSLLVAKDARVAAGQQIAAVGSTGESTGPHLHFEIWPSGWGAEGSSPIDPLPELQAWAAG